MGFSLGTNKSPPSECPRRPAPGHVVYVGRLPHGFYEDELRGYFSQFGDITRLRVSRNRTTGASKHYAFLEFAHSDVARIVVDTMHNYLLFGHLLQCALVPDDKLHDSLFRGANRKFAKVPWRKMAVKRFNEKRDRSKSDGEAAVARRLETCRQKTKEAGVEYDFDSVLHTLP